MYLLDNFETDGDVLCSLVPELLLRILTYLPPPSLHKFMSLSKRHRQKCEYDLRPLANLTISLSTVQLMTLSSLLNDLRPSIARPSMRIFRNLCRMLQNHNGWLMVDTEVIPKLSGAMTAYPLQLMKPLLPRLLNLPSSDHLKESICFDNSRQQPSIASRFTLPVVNKDKRSIYKSQRMGSGFTLKRYENHLSSECSRIYRHISCMYTLSDFMRAVNGNIRGIIWRDHSDSKAALELLNTSSMPHPEEVITKTRSFIENKEPSRTTTPRSEWAHVDFNDELNESTLRRENARQTMTDDRDILKRDLALCTVKLLTQDAAHDAAHVLSNLMLRASINLNHLVLQGDIFDSSLFREVWCSNNLVGSEESLGLKASLSLACNLILPKLTSICAPLNLSDGIYGPLVKHVHLWHVKSFRGLQQFLIRHSRTLQSLQLQFNNRDPRMLTWSENSVITTFPELNRVKLCFESNKNFASVFMGLTDQFKWPFIECFTLFKPLAARSSSFVSNYASSHEEANQHPTISTTISMDSIKCVQHLTLPDFSDDTDLENPDIFANLTSLRCPIRTFFRLIPSSSNAPKLSLFVCDSLQSSESHRLQRQLNSFSTINTLILPCDMSQYRGITYAHIRTSCFPGGVTSYWPKVTRHFARLPVALDLLLPENVNDHFPLLEELWLLDHVANITSIDVLEIGLKKARKLAKIVFVVPEVKTIDTFWLRFLKGQGFRVEREIIRSRTNHSTLNFPPFISETLILSQEFDASNFAGSCCSFCSAAVAATEEPLLHLLLQKALNGRDILVMSRSSPNLHSPS